MNQKLLAKKVGTTEAWLSRVLSLQAVGSDELISKIAKETGISHRLLIVGPASTIRSKLIAYFKRVKVEEARKALMGEK
jgi:transcriptional regulator with XRE-family HTH domain